MTDLRRLLHDSAPVPSGPLDMAAVRRRARRTGLRRVASWIAGLTVISGIGFPLGESIFVNADQPGRPRVERTSPETVEEDGDPTATTLRAGDGRDSGTSPVTSVTSLRAHPGPTTTTATVPAASHSGAEPSVAATADEGDYPSAPFCAVDNVGLGANQSRSCRFKATTRGGGTVKTTSPVYPPPGIRAEMRITRNGETTTHTIGHQRVQAGEAGTFYCGALIEPDDLVEVVLTNSPAPDGSTSTAGAGDGWECWNS